MATVYSVFYHTNDGFFLCKTDFENQTMAEIFKDSVLFTERGYKFMFMLEDGQTLIAGNPRQQTLEHYQQSMKFAVDIPRQQYAFIDIF